MLHGLCGSAIHFDTAFGNSDLMKHALLAIDLPGFGRSQSYGALSLESMRDAVAKLIKKYCDRKPWLVVHSISTSVAVRLLGDVFGVIFLEGDLLPEHLEFSDKIVSVERGEYDQSHKKIQRIAPIIMRYQTRLKDAKLIRYYSSSFRDCSADVVWNMAARANKDVRSLRPLQYLSSWQGQLGFVVSIGSVYEETISLVRAALPDIRTYQIKNSGHFPMIDNPSMTWAAVAREIEGE
jgi:pimeloyl-ACP methyl ester carboxylesterase